MENWRIILDAAAGLTRYEAEGAFSFRWSSWSITPEAIWELKSQMLKKSGSSFICIGETNHFLLWAVWKR